MTQSSVHKQAVVIPCTTLDSDCLMDHTQLAKLTVANSDGYTYKVCIDGV